MLFKYVPKFGLQAGLKYGLPLLLAFSAGGCLSISWEKHLHETPIETAVFKGLPIGEADLGDCLEVLGAPLFVDELGERTALTYGWGKNTAWNLSADLTFVEEGSSSISYGAVRARMRGVMLILDGNQVLHAVRRGKLTDLRRELERQRPQMVE